MLSHSIDKTQRGDESSVCGRLSNYRPRRGDRIRRSGRYRRQADEEQAAAAAADNDESSDVQEDNSESSKQLADIGGEEATVGVTDTFQSTEEDDTSKQNHEHNLKQTEEPNPSSQQDLKLDNAQKKKADIEVIHQETM
jgi:hypothetical protein